MSVRRWLRRAAASCSFALGVVLGAPLVLPLSAQAIAERRHGARVSIVYSGRTLGALGVRRSQEEHELLTEQARAEGQAFKLVSHLAWRAPGIVVFLPGTEPKGDELAEIVARRSEAEVAARVQALASSAVLLLQDPWNADADLIAMLERNPRRRAEFPDLVPTTLRVSRLRTAAEQRVIIVEQPGAAWPTELSAWSRGEMNRVDVGESRIFELPLNLGGVGPRATLLRQLQNSADSAAATLLVDLGHQDGDFGLERRARARVDFAALRALGYAALVPFESELALGVDGLRAVHDEVPEIPLLAANVRATDSTLFTPRLIVTRGGRRIGLIGLVNGTLRERLARGALVGFRFEAPVEAARREVAALRTAGVDAIVVLSNLEPREHATLAQEVSGIDAIVADLPVRAPPETMRLRVEMPERPFVRPGTPPVIAQGAANGLSVGALTLEFTVRPDGAGAYVTAIEHRSAAVTDRTPSDTALVQRLEALAASLGRAQEDRGELMFPAFPDIVERHPDLAEFDAVTRRGRVSKGLWESYLARRLRVLGNGEVAVMRRLDHFAPLIGKLHGNEIDEWLWMEDAIVVLDVPGADLKALLQADTRGELVTSGIDRANNTILGHRIQDDAPYRVVTSDVLVDGARARFFRRGLRARRSFALDAATGALVADRAGRAVTVRELVLHDLQRVRAVARGEAQIDSLAAHLAPDPAHVSVTSLAFDRPTIWASMNRITGNSGYDGVPESRVLAQDAWVAGLSGRVVLTRTKRAHATDFGLGFAFAQQRANGAGPSIIETADDIKLDWTLRPALRANTGWRPYPFVRTLFDTEFSPTVDRVTGRENPRQLSLRGVSGVMRAPSERWPHADLGVVIENDFGRPNLQTGVQTRVEYTRPVGPAVTYRLRSDLTYFLPTPRDTPADLALRHSLVHDFVVPLVDELALAISADFFIFQGKVAATRAVGVSSQLRVGLTYNRLWKPVYQPFL